MKEKPLPQGFRYANQITKALKQGHAKPPHFEPDLPEESKTLIRDVCVRKIYARWNNEKEPSKLEEVIREAQEELEGFYKDRTVERRINETTYPELYGGTPPIIGLGRGVYMPNPARYGEEFREEMLKIINLIGER